MLKALSLVAALLFCSVAHAQDVFQPAITAQADVGRYNAKGERLSNRSPKHVLDNADKTHFTLAEWCSKLEGSKSKKEKDEVAKFLYKFARESFFTRYPQDKEDLRNGVLILVNSNDPLVKSVSVEIIIQQFRGEFQRELILLSKDDSPQVKHRAFRALGYLPMPGLVDLFGTALNDPKENRLVKVQAAKSLALKLEHSDEYAIEHLENGLRANRRDKEISKIIEDALAKHYARTN